MIFQVTLQSTYKDGNTRFTTVPYKPLSDKQLKLYFNFPGSRVYISDAFKLFHCSLKHQVAKI